MKNLSLLLFLFIFAMNPAYSQDTLHVPAAYTTIQGAIDDANNGDIVLVAEDTYYENINYNGKAITVASHFLIDGDESHIDSTIIDGSLSPDNESVVLFLSGEDTNSVLCGFTITGGTGHDDRLGGGIYITDCSPLISNNIISGNISSWGAGIEVALCSPLIRNNFITGNSSVYGGGIDLWGSNSSLFNNVIADNIAFHGGGIYIEDAQPIVINNTIVNNTGEYSSGGIWLNVEPIILNSILWGNTAPIDSQIYSSNVNLDVFYSDIQGGWSGTGNINVYPEFVDTATGDYHLSDTSPCIGAGIDSLEVGGTWYYSPITDLEGNPRPNPSGSMPDMGAYEFGLPVGVEDHLVQIPEEYSLEQNYPNPYNPSTNIRYSIPQSSSVVVKVFDILGNEIETLVSEEKQIGTYEITWYADNLPSGVYFYSLQAGDFIETRKMVLMK